MLVSVKLDLQNCFENQDDYEDNQGAEIFVSETSKEYKILLISEILFCKQADQV